MDVGDLPSYLNGLRSTTAWAILALHSINAIAVDEQGRVIANGFAMMEIIKHPNYWTRMRERQVPEYLWTFRDMAIAEPERTAEVVGEAEGRLFVNMVGVAFELAQSTINRDRLRKKRIADMPWYKTAKTVRNTVFHDEIVREWDGIAFPTQWRDLVFTRDMINKPLQTIGFFDMDHAFQLVADIAESAATDFR